MIPGLDYALEDQGRIWGREDVGNLPFSKRERQGYEVLSRNAPRDCRATTADQSANGARQGYGVLSRNASRDCRATTVDQSANGARQGYGGLSRNAPRDCRATTHVTVAQLEVVL